MSIRQIVKSATGFWWRTRGHRTLRMFGHDCRFVPHTHLSFLRPSVAIPTEHAVSNLYHYADLVQAHAACRYLWDLKRPAVVVEVGAYHGTYAVPFGKLLREHGGKMIAIEPNPTSFDILCRNVRLNGLEDIVQCEQLGVMDRPGIMRLDPANMDTQLTNNAAAPVEVAVTTLAELLEKNNIRRVDLLQIDVEGAELPVLRGFPWGEVDIDWILCEMHPCLWTDFNYDAAAINAFLRERGLRCVDAYLHDYDDFTTAIPCIVPSVPYIGPSRLIPVNRPAETKADQMGPAVVA